jgi:hypothetical protein
MWCADKVLLRSIVGLTHGPHLQDQPSIDGFCTILSKALHSQSLKAKFDATTAKLCSGATEHCNEALLKACSGVCSQDDAIRIIWLPEYGSAIVCRRSEFLAWHVNLVCLDEWSLLTHHLADYTSRAHGFAILPFAATIADIDLFCKCFQSAFENMQQRLAKLKKKQNTPSVVEAVIEDTLSALEIIDSQGYTVKDALQCVEESGMLHPLRGGFTDVGRHYGAEPRATCWPLVEGVFCMLLEWIPVNGECAVPKLYELFSACLILWLTEQQLELTEKHLKLTCRSLKTNELTTQINAVMELLGLASQKGAVLSGDFGLEMAEYARQCTQYRQRLDKAHISYTTIQSKQFDLPSKISEIPTSLLHLHVREPKRKQVGVNREQVEVCAQSNINWLPLWEPLNISGGTEASLECASAIVAWLNHSKIVPDSKSTCQIVMRNVEYFFFENVRFLETQLQISDADAYPEALMVILETYRVAVSIFRTLDTHAQLRVEVMSREMLIVWIVKCLIDKSTRTKYDTTRFGSALQWQDLRHLVLADKLAMDASLCVCIYLRHITTAQPIFSLAQEDSTFKLASEFASRDQTLKDVWAAESAAAAKRQEDHWKRIQEKKDLVRKLCEELRSLKNTESTLESKIDSLGDYHDRYKRKEKKSDLKGVQAEIKQKNREIGQAKKAPEAVFQPLPADKTLAMRVLFFLHMPKHFQALSQVVVMAQQMLLPKASLFEQTALCAHDNILSDVEKAIDVRKAKTSWLEYYNSHSPTIRSCETPICLWSDCVPPEPRLVYLHDVMDYHYRGQGIWHPDDLTPRMMWAGGSFVLDKRVGWFNPFAQIPDEWVVENFTERLPGEASNLLQWVLPQYGANTKSSRGNKAIACQHLKPFWLNKPQFLHFGVIRAFPQQQLRKLCTSLHDRDLPLVHHAVHTLFRQTLYHTGDICEGEDPTFAWKADQLVTGKVLCMLQEELVGLARELRTTPRNHAAVLLLGEVAAYLSQWDYQGHADARSVAREFAGE